MSPANSRRHGLTKPDSKGYFRPYIGHLDGKQIRFNLGKDQRQAEGRYHRIHDLYTDCGVGWTEQALAFAKQIAAGNAPQFVPQPAPQARSYGAMLHYGVTSFGFEIDTQPYWTAQYAQQLEKTKKAFPSLPDLPPDDAEKHVASIEANRDFIAQKLAQLKSELDRLGVLAAGNATLPAKLIPGTLHEALDAYQTDFEVNATRLPSGQLKQNERKRQGRIATFKKTHPDCPLHDLTLARVKEFAGWWRNCPVTNTGRRSSRAYAKHHLGEWFRFLKWLDGSDRYLWDAPKGMEAIGKKIPKFEAEKKLTAVTKHVYQPKQLAKIANTATDSERLALYLGLNCAMGAAELGRLVIDDFAIKVKHPYPTKLGIKTKATDSWLRYFRPKTEVFGEWKLWPETVDLVEWAIARANKIGSNLIFCRTTAKPLFDDDSAKPDAGFANLWERCLNRSKIETKLPFGSLRDTLPDYLRQTYDGGTELGSLCLTHGTPGIDELIDCYANRPWGRLHTAITAAHSHFAPLWSVHKKPEAF